jgi:hypothetical protein
MSGLTLIRGGRTLDLEDVVTRIGRRPGDVREPVVVVLDTDLDCLAKAVNDYGFLIDEGLPWLWERYALLQRVTDMGVAIEVSCALLDRTAQTSRVTEPLGATESAYLRGLTRGRRPPRLQQIDDAIVVGMPRRLRADPRRVRFEEESYNEALAQAHRWEIAAISCRMTMMEWGLHGLLSRVTPQLLTETCR